MTNQGSFLLGLTLGAGMMYLLDPERGRRRRALLRDRVVHGAHELEGLGDAAGGRARDLRNRALGAVHETRARLRAEVVDDPVLEARVRSELGRRASSPGLVEVFADHGRIVLSGEVPAGELERILRGVAAVRGVHDLVNRLRVREASGDAPGMRESSR